MILASLHVSLKLITAVPEPDQSIKSGLNSYKTSPDMMSIPSRIRPGTANMAVRNSSTIVDERPSGSICGTGLNSLSSALYCGTRLLSPPEWITSTCFPTQPPFSFSHFSTDKIASPEPTRTPLSSGITANLVRKGRWFLRDSI